MSSREPGLPEPLAGLLRQVDAVPEWVLELGRAAHDMRTMDAELARLEVDSLHAPAGAVRAGDEVRLLTFAAERLRIELEVTTGTGGVTVRGQVTPEARALVTLQARGQEGARAEAGADGRFSLEHPAAGIVRLHVVSGDATLVTDWISL